MRGKSIIDINLREEYIQLTPDKNQYLVRALYRPNATDIMAASQVKRCRCEYIPPTVQTDQ